MSLLQQASVGSLLISLCVSLFLSVSCCCFSSNNPAHKYYLAVDPVSGSLFVSDTNSRRIFRVKALSGAKDLAGNSEVVAGTGEQCLPFDEARCGDGGKAVDATLMSPRGKWGDP